MKTEARKQTHGLALATVLASSASATALLYPSTAHALCSQDTPSTNAVITCTGLDNTGLQNASAENVTVNVETGATVTATSAGGSANAIVLGDRANITNSGQILGTGKSAAIDVGENSTIRLLEGSVTRSLIVGGGSTIYNFGTITETDGIIGDDILNTSGATSGITLINDGTIQSTTRRIFLSQQDDVLEIRSNSHITAETNATGGNDTFRFGGDENFAFNIASVSGDALNNGEQYREFETFEKTGNSIVTLTGDNSEIPLFSVTGGGLRVNGNMQNTDFTLTGGGLGGVGTVKSFIANANGIIAPGNSIGTLNVVGGATFQPGSSYNVELAPDGSSDKIAVGGTLTINGGQVVPEFTSDSSDQYEDGQQYTIATAGSVTGQFTGVKDDFAFVDFELRHLATGVVLELDILDEDEDGTPDFSSVAQSGNQLGVGKALESFDSSDAEETELKNALMGLSGDEARKALNSLTGENQTSGQTSANASGQQFNTLLGGQAAGSGQTFALGGSADRAGLSVEQLAAFYASGRSSAAERLGNDASEQKTNDTTVPESIFAADVLIDEAPETASLGPSVWLSGFGGQSDVDGDGNASGFDSYAWGLAGGLETVLSSGSRVGASIGYSKSNIDLNDRSQDSEINSYHIGAYASGGAGRLQNGINWRVAAAFAHHDTKSIRNIAIGAVNRTAEADYDARTLSGFGEIRYNHGLDGSFGRTVLSPLARVDVAHTDTDGFTETGAGGLNLTNSAQTFRQVWLGAGIGLAGDYKIGGFNWRPNWTVAYERNVGDNRASVSSTLAGSPVSFSTSGIAESRDRIRFGSASTFDLSDKASLTIATDRTWSSDRTDWSGKATLSLRF